MPQTTTGPAQINVLSVLGGSKRYARIGELSSSRPEVLCTWDLEFRTWYFVLCNWYLVLRTSYFVLCTWYLVLRTSYFVLCTWYLVLRTSYFVLGTLYLVLSGFVFRALQMPSPRTKYKV
jgi:hypothetical protein